METGLLLLGTLFLGLQDPPTLSLASGTDARHLRVEAIKELTLERRTVLDDVEFLPIEIAARTSAWQWHPDRPHLGAVTAGPTRVELPSGGALLKYRRGGVRYGYLLITSGGRPVPLVERRGVGAAAADPFGSHVGVATDGSAATVATATEVLLLRLDGTRFASTGAANRAVLTTAAPTRPRSLLLGAGTLYFQTGDQRLFRCATTDLAVPAEVALGSATPQLLVEEMAISGDGSTIAVLYGSDATHLELAVVTGSGSPRIVSHRLGAWLAPGYLPEDTRGPHLALADDGQSVAFSETGTREDFYFVPAVATPQALQINTTANFNPYVDTGVFFIFIGTVLTVGLGDDPDAVDLYRVTGQGATGLAITNLTQTSGINGPPFGGRPTLDLRGIQRGPGGSLAVVHQRSSGLELLTVEPVSGRQTVMATDLLAAPVAQPTGPGLFPDLIASSPNLSQLLFPAATGFVDAFKLPAALPVRRSARRAVDGGRLISVGLLPGIEVAFAVPVLWAPTVIRTTPTQATLWTTGDGLLVTEPTATGVLVDYYDKSAVLRLGQAPITLVLNHAAH